MRVVSLLAAALLLAGLVGCEFLAGIKDRHGPRDAGAGEAGGGDAGQDAAHDGAPDGTCDGPAPSDAAGDSASGDDGPPGDAPADAPGGCGPGTCAGCCEDLSTCRTVPDLEHCGVNGSGCIQCNATLHDRCNTLGACACGNGTLACHEGQHCAGGSCICDIASCTSGCCGGDQECHIDDPSHCGMSGGSCAACGSGDVCCEGTCVPPGGPSTAPGVINFILSVADCQSQCGGACGSASRPSLTYDPMGSGYYTAPFRLPPCNYFFASLGAFSGVRQYKFQCPGGTFFLDPLNGSCTAGCQPGCTNAADPTCYNTITVP